MKRPFRTARFDCATLRQLLKRARAEQEPLPFLDEHPIIRPLDDYAAVVARAIHRQDGSLIHERRFYEAWLGRSSHAAEAAPRGANRQGYDCGARRALDPTIPCRVAPQQSPTPFLRTFPA